MAMRHNGLAKLAEELGELGQVVGKKLQYPEGPHPDGQGSLVDRLEDEMGDVIAAMQFVTTKLNLEPRRIAERAMIKLAQFKQWDTE